MKELVDAMETLDTDEIADLVEDLPPDVVAEVQEGLTTKQRAQLRAAMSYPEDSVGARMDFEIVSVREEANLEMVLRYLRSFEELPEHSECISIIFKCPFAPFEISEVMEKFCFSPCHNLFFSVFHGCTSFLGY